MGGSLPHPAGEFPSRTLFVRNISSAVDDSELRALFEPIGPVRSMYTASKHRGFVMVSYFDLRDARTAMQQLQGKTVRRRAIDLHFSIPKDNPSERDQNQGTLVVFNVDPAVTHEELMEVFGQYGEVREIRESPHKRHHKFVEFYDVREADRALRMLNKTELRGKRIKIEPSRQGGQRKLPSSPLADMAGSPPDLEDSAGGSESEGGSIGRPLEAQQAPAAEGVRNGPDLGAEPLGDYSFLDDMANHANHANHAVVNASPPHGNQHHHPHQSASAGGREWAGPGEGFGHGAMAGRAWDHQAPLVHDHNAFRAPGGGGVGATPSRFDEGASVPGDGGADPGKEGGGSAKGRFALNPHANFVPSGSMWGASGAMGLQDNLGHHTHPSHPHHLHGHNQAIAPPHSPAAMAFMQGDEYAPHLGHGAPVHGFRSVVPHQSVPGAPLNHMPGMGIGPGVGVGVGMGRGARRVAGGRENDRSMFKLDVDRVQAGDDNRTTLMVRNIPNKYSQKMLLQTIDVEFRGTYDFFYLPIDFKNKCNMGYAFINFVAPDHIVPFYHRFCFKKWDRFNSEKVCELAYARIQGKVALVHHFSNSSLLSEDKKCRPLLFVTAGPNKGQPEPFPVSPHPRVRMKGQREGLLLGL